MVGQHRHFMVLWTEETQVAHTASARISAVLLLLLVLPYRSNHVVHRVRTSMFDDDAKSQREESLKGEHALPQGLPLL
jgi:predicted solute-binding protein